MTLLEHIKNAVEAGYEKNTHYENSENKDQFIEDKINEMSNVELLERIDWYLTR